MVRGLPASVAGTVDGWSACRRRLVGIVWLWRIAQARRPIGLAAFGLICVGLFLGWQRVANRRGYCGRSMH